jgi:hypothetical protein
MCKGKQKRKKDVRRRGNVSSFYLFFPFSLPSLLSLSSHPSILDITIVIITS